MTTKRIEETQKMFIQLRGQGNFTMNILDILTELAQRVEKVEQNAGLKKRQGMVNDSFNKRLERLEKGKPNLGILRSQAEVDAFNSIKPADDRTTDAEGEIRRAIESNALALEMRIKSIIAHAKQKGE